MVDFVMAVKAAEIGPEVELFREILHAVIKVCGKHHLKFLRVDLTVLVHHEIRGTGGFEIEAVVGSVCISQAQDMTEFMRAFLLESVPVGILSDRRDARMFSGPVKCQRFRLETLKEPPSPAP